MMIRVEAKHLEGYWRNEYFPSLLLGISLAIACGGTWLRWLSGTGQAGRDTGLALFAVGLALLTFGVLEVIDSRKKRALREEKNGEAYRLICRWVRCGGRLREFPLTEEGRNSCKMQSGYALHEAGLALINARRKYVRFLELNPPSKFLPETKHGQIKAMFRKEDKLREAVRLAEIEYEEKWSVLTEAGTGILTGPFWSDRQEFLDQVRRHERGERVVLMAG